MTSDSFHRAEAYVLGELTAPEREAFERTLRDDERLRGEVERLRAEIHAVRERAATAAIAAAGARFRRGGDADARPSIGERAVPAAPAPARRGRRGRGRRLRRFVSVAAAAAAVLLVAAWIGGLFGERAADRPPGAFEPAIGLPTTLGVDDGAVADERTFTEGMIDYKLGDFPAALARWEPLLEARPADDTLAFYTAVALIATGREAEAADLLQAVDEPALRERRDWYLAQAYRRARRSEEARALLNEIAAGGGRYAEEARRVLDYEL